MLEDIFDIARGRLFIDEFAQLQLREHAVEFGVSSLHDAPNQPERELSAEHGERLQTGPSHRAAAGRDVQQESSAPFFSSFSGFVSLTAPLRASAPSSKSTSTVSSMKKFSGRLAWE